MRIRFTLDPSRCRENRETCNTGKVDDTVADSQALTPLQPKQLRLQDARSLMLVHDIDVTTAALRTGYESPSQFSREYRRHFGEPPARDIARLRASPGLAVVA